MKNEELINRMRMCVNGNCEGCTYEYEGLTNTEECKEDLISDAADAIEELQKALDAVNDAHNEGYDVCYWAGRRDYEPKWIPVTERVPELGQEVLVYAIGKDDGFIGDSVIALSERFIFRLFPSSDGVEEWRSPWQYFDSNYEITHWMPLPEPPKGEVE